MIIRLFRAPTPAHHVAVKSCFSRSPYELMTVKNEPNLNVSSGLIFSKSRFYQQPAVTRIIFLAGHRLADCATRHQPALPRARQLKSFKSGFNDRKIKIQNNIDLIGAGLDMTGNSRPYGSPDRDPVPASKLYSLEDSFSSSLSCLHLLSHARPLSQVTKRSISCTRCCQIVVATWLNLS